MNVVDFTPPPKVLKLARQLLAEAGRNEVEIKKDIEKIAKDHLPLATLLNALSTQISTI